MPRSVEADLILFTIVIFCIYYKAQQISVLRKSLS